MVPWPIAFLTLFYAMIATSSAVSVWKGISGASAQSPIWPVGWCALSAGATIGLPLLKPWARQLAIWTSILLLITTLAIAGLLVAAAKPGAALLTTILAGTHGIVIRYLQRPAVKQLFGIRQTAHRTG